MQVTSQGRDLLDRLQQLSGKSTMADTQRATKVSCLGVEKAMEDIHEKRKLLDDLWMERSGKLGQLQALKDIDTEVNKVRVQRL